MADIYTVGFSVLGESTKAQFEFPEIAAEFARTIDDAGYDPSMWDHNRDTYDYTQDPPVVEEGL